MGFVAGVGVEEVASMAVVAPGRDLDVAEQLFEDQYRHIVASISSLPKAARMAVILGCSAIVFSGRFDQIPDLQ